MTYKTMTLKNWIENETSLNNETIIDHTVDKDKLDIEMKYIYDDPHYFDFYLWSKNSVYIPYEDEGREWGWSLGAVPRNPFKK